MATRWCAAARPAEGGNACRGGRAGVARRGMRVSRGASPHVVRRAPRCAVLSEPQQGGALSLNLKGVGLGVGVSVVAAAAAAAVMVPGPAWAAAAPTPAMSSNAVVALLQFVLHLEHHLGEIIAQYGAQVYGILFAIVFCETGLVVTPFLPGDSLLFAAGSFCALGKLNLPLMLGLFMVAAVAGDAMNYAIGKAVGQRAFELDTWFLRKSNLAKTEAFYAKHGPKAIVLARFLPIVRTFAPFVAGIGSMEYKTFALYNVVGATVWVFGFTLLGFLFGNVPIVQNNFSAVVLGIIAVSVVPVIVEVIKARSEEKAA